MKGESTLPQARATASEAATATLLQAILAELRASRQDQARRDRCFDEFLRVFLNTRFPYGKPTDRWARRG